MYFYIFCLQTSFSSFVAYLHHFGYGRSVAIIVALIALVSLRVEGSVWITHWSNEWQNNMIMAAEKNNYRLIGFFFIGCFQGKKLYVVHPVVGIFVEWNQKKVASTNAMMVKLKR